MIAAKAAEPGRTKKAEAPEQKAQRQAASPQAPTFNPLWQQLALGVQAKLAVSAPDDPHEREADRVADRVMRMADRTAVRSPLSFSAIPVRPTQRKCAACEEEEKLQRKENASTAGTSAGIPPGVHETLSAPGQPLDPTTRGLFEQRFGRDFSRVRVHTDGQAARTAKAIHALAFTHGQDIYFGEGQFQPGRAQGDKLLAHELTHTVQQGEASGVQVQPVERAAVNQPDELDGKPAAGAAEQVTSDARRQANEITPARSLAIQRQPESALIGAVGVFYPAAVLIGKNSTYELKGSGKFEPDLFLKAYILDQGNHALINVRFGNLAKGKLYVEKRESGEYRAAPTALPMIHPDITPPGAGKHLSLIVSIETGNEITGSIGVTQALPPNSIGAAYGSPEDQERFLELLIGQTAAHGKLENIKIQNELKNGFLNFWYVFVNHLYPGTYLIGIISIANELFLFKGSLHTSGKGLMAADTDVARDKTGDLFGRIEMGTEWEAKGFNGKLNATYEDGILEIRGSLKYDSPRVKGNLNVLATEENRARQAIQSQLAAIQPGGAVGAGGSTPASGTMTPSGSAPGGGAAAVAGGDTGGVSRLALTGWGVLNLVVTDKIDADAAFVVDPDGYLTVRGTIRSPHKITLMDAKPLAEENLFEDDYSEMVPVLWAAGVRAKVHATLTASAIFGPLTLHHITITGVYSTRPGAGSEIEIYAKVNLSASAKARFEVGGELAARLGTKYKYLGVSVASVALNIAPEAEVRGVVEAQPTIKRQTKGTGSSDEKPKYIIGGELFIGGELDLKLTGDLVFAAAGVEIHTIHLGDKVYPIAGFGLTTDVSYTLGSDETPKVNYKKGRFEPSRFIRQIIQEKHPKDTDGKVTGGFKEDGKEKGKVVSSADIPPEPPQPSKTQLIQFSMAGSPHTLFLTLAGPAEPVTLEMASKRGPVRPKIYKAQRDLIDVKYDGETDEATKNKIDRRINDLQQADRDAARVEQAAFKLGGEPEATPMDAPGLKELGDELQNYGERYHVTDLTEPTPGQAQPTGPAQPGTGPGIDQEAEDVMSSWTDLKKDQQVIDQVRRILNTGSLPQSQFRTIMDKVKINRAAGKRFLGYLEQLVVRKFSGISVVFSDLEIGGNKFLGAAFMLRYIDENDLWGSVTEFEATRDDRRIDAIIRRTQYEFKSWGEFRANTFMEQIGKDYERTGLRGVRWVLQKRELGDKGAIIQLMKEALNDKDLRKKYGISLADSKAIIDELDRIVIVH